MMFGSKLKIKPDVGRLMSPVLPSHTANVLEHKVEKDSVKQFTFLTAKVKLYT